MYVRGEGSSQLDDSVGVHAGFKSTVNERCLTRGGGVNHCCGLRVNWEGICKNYFQLSSKLAA